MWRLLPSTAIPLGPTTAHVTTPIPPPRMSTGPALRDRERLQMLSFLAILRAPPALRGLTRGRMAKASCWIRIQTQHRECGGRTRGRRTRTMGCCASARGSGGGGEERGRGVSSSPGGGGQEPGSGTSGGGAGPVGSRQQKHALRKSTLSARHIANPLIKELTPKFKGRLAAARCKVDTGARVLSALERRVVVAVCSSGGDSSSSSSGSGSDQDDSSSGGSSDEEGSSG